MYHLSRCKVVVFWTKNPRPILPYLHELDERGIHYYFQVTLNDYVNEGFEPNVPTVEQRIETFSRLSEMIGHERVIWRFDPLIITPVLTPRMLLSRIWKIGNRLKGYTDKLVFSFVDVKAYRKVQNNLVKEKLREAWAANGWNIELATCAEDIDLEAYDIAHNCCIDGELMKRIFHDDEELVYYLHTGQLPEWDMFGIIPPLPNKSKNLKDKGQRKVCGCMISKDIGMYDTCRHFCVYCYANTSRECVQKNQMRHSDDSESLID